MKPVCILPYQHIGREGEETKYKVIYPQLVNRLRQYALGIFDTYEEAEEFVRIKNYPLVKCETE